MDWSVLYLVTAMPVKIVFPETGTDIEFTLRSDNTESEKEDQEWSEINSQYPRGITGLLETPRANPCLEWLKERLSQEWPQNDSPYSPTQTYV